MVEIVKQIIKLYLEKNSVPKVENLNISDKDKKLLEEKTWLFVTLYKVWEVAGSSWSVKESEENIVLELIVNTIWALEDSRFKDNKLASEDLEKLKIRVDTVEAKNQLKWKDSILKINHIKSGVLVIKPDYSKIALILPNISKSITTAKDFIDVLSAKLGEKYKEKDYINYELVTKQYTNF